MEFEQQHMSPVVEVPVAGAELASGVEADDGLLLHPTSALLHLLPGSQIILRGPAPDDSYGMRARRWTIWFEPLPPSLADRLADAAEAMASTLDRDASRLREAAEVLRELSAIPCDVA